MSTVHLLRGCCAQSTPCASPNIGYTWVVELDYGDTTKLDNGNGSELRCVWHGEMP